MNDKVNSRWKIAAIILGIVALAQMFEIFRIKSTLENVFHYNVAVTVKDKNTGKILEGVTTHFPSTSPSDLFLQSYSTSGGIQTRKIRGIAYEPREFLFSLDGYKQENLVVTDDTPFFTTVELEPKNEKSEPAGTGQPM